MKKVLIVFSMIFFTSVMYAQNFGSVQELELPDSITAATIETADANHDGLIDLLVFAASAKGKFLYIVKGDTSNAPVLHDQVMALPEYSRYVITDTNHDNQLDIMLSVTEKTKVLVNQGSFRFLQMETSLPAFSALRLADLDGDGRRECVLSGTENGAYFTRTYRSSGDLVWAIEHDSLTVGLSAIEVMDMDGNGLQDLNISGKESDGAPFTSILFGTALGFSERRIWSSEMALSLVDSDLDGTLDLIGYGTLDSGEPLYGRARKSNDFIPESLPLSGVMLSSFHADLNSDGMPDQNTLQLTAANDTLNVIRYSNGIDEVISDAHLLQQSFYDVEQDGDLDLVQIVSDNVSKILWFENTTGEENKGPDRFPVAAVPVFDRVLLYWERTNDDHTSAGSITYDVYLEGNTISQEVLFDLNHGKRVRAAHGNNGTNNFILVKNRSEGFNFAIQGVDNALFASPEGICVGNSTPCGEPEHEVITVCTTEKISLPAPDGALWFSFSKGFLGVNSSQEYDPQSQDTVFYLLPTEACPVVKTFEFKMSDEVQRLEPETIFACAGEGVVIAVDESFTDIRWSSEGKGVLGETAAITFRTEGDDVVRVMYKDEMKCDVEKQFGVTVSVPLLTTGAQTYRLLKGQSVQLNATGAEHYQWSPAEGLSNPGVSNPVASPSKDTRYVVTGTDSIGCAASVEVDVIVQSTGFIPSLFTPNGDGQNDILKVYGLGGVESFSLRIVNREGSVVFKTENLAEAAGAGWNGETNGIKQPNGVYFWKVEGMLSSGNGISLNGKKEGSLVLLR